MAEDNLATELLHTLKSSIKRLYVILVILIVLLFGTNIAWLYAWNLPSEETTSTSYDIQAEDEGNAVYNESEGVTINGEDSSK